MLGLAFRRLAAAKSSPAYGSANHFLGQRATRLLWNVRLIFRGLCREPSRATDGGHVGRLWRGHLGFR